jgi:putative addiction module component (TIGR02574 family)
MQLTQEEITRLSPDERLSLIAQLWDSLEDHQVQLTPAQQPELERRLATLDDDRAQSVTWETLKAELEQRRPSCGRFVSPKPRALNLATRKTATRPRRWVWAGAFVLRSTAWSSSWPTTPDNFPRSTGSSCQNDCGGILAKDPLALE